MQSAIYFIFRINRENMSVYGGGRRVWQDSAEQVGITHPTYRPADPNRQPNVYFKHPNNTRVIPEPWIGATSLSESPWQQPYLWQETLDPNAPGAQPEVLHPAPEGYQPHTDHSNTEPAYWAPEMPIMYGPQNRSDPSQWRQDQESMLSDNGYYPVHRNWDQMTPYEQQTFVGETQRDKFLQKIWLDVDNLLAERQFQILHNPNRIEDRDAYMHFQFGSRWDDPENNFSLRPNFKDKWSQMYTKHHLHP
jgi:hypothetical protein